MPDDARHHARLTEVLPEPILAGAHHGIRVRLLTHEGSYGSCPSSCHFSNIRIEMDIKAKNATDADLDDLLHFAQAHSPVCNTVCRPVAVVVERVSR